MAVTVNAAAASIASTISQRTIFFFSFAFVMVFPPLIPSAGVRRRAAQPREAHAAGNIGITSMDWPALGIEPALIHRHHAGNGVVHHHRDTLRRQIYAAFKAFLCLLLERQPDLMC